MSDVISQTTELTVEAPPVQALGALLGNPLAEVRNGDRLPPLWHWVALATWPDVSTTGQDGHPATGGFIPDVGKPRRMFAGGEVRLLGPLHVGEVVERRDTVLSIEAKSGRQGDFVLVTVETEIVNVAGHVCVVERQNLVYRDASPPRPRSGPVMLPEPVAIRSSIIQESAGGGLTFGTDTTKLLRFSAATSNSHRIHYDLAYAVQVEGYPGLVVQGPLMTLAMLQVVGDDLDHRTPVVIRHRNLAPLFCGQEADVSVSHTLDGITVDLSHDGVKRVTLSIAAS